jgi:hypothetical protein
VDNVACLEEMHNKIFIENMKRKDLGVNGRAIVKQILKEQWEGVDWILLAQD